MIDKTEISNSFNQAQTDLVIQTADLPLGTLAEMTSGGSIDLKPGFQRRERWDQVKQSRLIESFLLNIPVPPIYLSEEPDGTYIAIDGKQRLQAITSFINDEIRLKGLEQLLQAEGAKFSDLPKDVHNSLKLRPYIRVVTLLKQSNEKLKYEVFLRLNRGGETLNPQEIRNVAFRGPMNQAIYDASRNDFLKSRLKIKSDNSEAYRQMNDAETVLRFLTLNSSWVDFTGDLSSSMDKYMMDSNSLSPAQVIQKIGQFEHSITACEQIWGEVAFKRAEGDGWRDQMMLAVYDAQMISVSNLSQNRVNSLAAQSQQIIARTHALFSDEIFNKSIRTSTNTPTRIKYRVQKFIELLREF